MAKLSTGRLTSWLLVPEEKLRHGISVWLMADSFAHKPAILQIYDSKNHRNTMSLLTDTFAGINPALVFATHEWVILRI